MKTTDLTTYAAGFKFEFSDSLRTQFEVSGSDNDFRLDNFNGTGAERGGVDALGNFVEGDPTPDDPNDIIATYRFNGTQIVVDTLIDETDPSNFEPGAEFAKRRIGNDQFNLRTNDARHITIKNDWQYDLTDDGETSIEFGFKYQNIEENPRRFRGLLVDPTEDDRLFVTQVPGFDPVGSIVTQTVNGVEFSTVDGQIVRTLQNLLSFNEVPDQPDHFRFGDRDIIAAYAMLNFSNPDSKLPFRGNAGVRFVSVDTDLSGFTI